MAVELLNLPELDVNQKLVNDDGTPSPYFEELWYLLRTSITNINICLEDHEARITALEGP